MPGFGFGGGLAVSDGLGGSVTWGFVAEADGVAEEAVGDATESEDAAEVGA